MAQQLQDKVAVITGGTSGIGRGTVVRFVEEGARVVFCGRSVEDGERIAQELGENARFVRADVTKEEDLKTVIGTAVDAFGRLDCLFNNAGGPADLPVEAVTTDDFHAAMDLLLGSVVFGMKHAAPVMKAQGSGRIINNSSVAALRTGMAGYLYSAAKAGVTQATRMAGVELGPFGITVNSVSPGAIATPIFYGGSEASRQLSADHADGKMKKLTGNLAAANPLGVSGFPEDIANAVVFLASDGARFINCHDLVVDGGMTAGATYGH